MLLHTLRTLRPPRLDRFFSSGMGRAFLVRALSGSASGETSVQGVNDVKRVYGGCG